MLQALFYKEWIKTRWFLAIAFLISIGISIYSMMIFKHAMDMKGIAHIWVMMLTRKVTLVHLITYVPIAIGLCLGVVQFVPEMYKKSIKLSLHLPFDINRSIAIMLLWGAVCLAICFQANFLIVWNVLHPHLPSELLAQSLSTIYPSYIAGFFIYFMTATIVLEPTWKWRLGYIIISALGLHLFLLSQTPFAYNKFTWGLMLITIIITTFSWRSIYRFKVGCQD